jgi:hypothetical protein
VPASPTGWSSRSWCKFWSSPAPTAESQTKGARPPRCASAAPANRHDSPLLLPTLEHASESVGVPLDGTSVYLDRGYDSELTRDPPAARGLVYEISEKGKPAPLQATKRWVVERTSSWPAKLAHKKLLWCTERRGEVIDFWIAFSDVVIVVRRLIREGWIRYRWESRPARRP